jgi:hypothetical protein
LPDHKILGRQIVGYQGFRAPARRNTDCEKAQRYTLTRRHHLRPSLAGGSVPRRSEESRWNAANQLQGLTCTGTESPKQKILAVFFLPKNIFPNFSGACVSSEGEGITKKFFGA